MQIKFRLHERVQTFLAEWRWSVLADPVVLKPLVGVVGGYLALMYFLGHSSGWSWVALTIFIVAMGKMMEALHRHVTVPAELLLALTTVLILLEKWLLGMAVDPLGGPPGRFSAAVQVLLLGVLLIAFMMLLIRGEWNKWGRLFYLGFLAGVWASVVVDGNALVEVIFAVILFFALMRATAWLEELTQIECWIALVAAWLLYDFTITADPLSAVHLESGWLFGYLPAFVLLGWKLYLLAIMVKVPVVLVYNHASLKRKLSIAAFFQSTFPQLIQLAILLLVFLMVVSGWQARNLADAVRQETQRLATSALSDLPYPVFEVTPDAGGLRFEGPDGGAFRSMRLGSDLGMLVTATPEGDSAFYLYTLMDDSSATYRLTPLDSAFMGTLGGALPVMAGNEVYGAGFSPDYWTNYFYTTSFLRDEGNVQINPFPGVLFGNDGLRAPIGSVDTTGNVVRLRIFNQRFLTLGRAALPLDGGARRYFQFAIVLDLHQQYEWSVLAKVLVFILVLYLVLNTLVVRRMISFGQQIHDSIVAKFGMLRTGIEEIATGHLDYRIRMEGADEFVELADRFNQMGERLREDIEARREKDRLQYELQNARDVQLGLLPRTLPELPGYELAAGLRTATEVGGDFYDIIPLDDRRYLFTVGDVSGKGSSAALYMAQCMSLIRYSGQFTDDPLKICLQLNAFFRSAISDRQIFVTAIVGVLDIAHHRIDMVRAGHTPPIHLPANRADRPVTIDSKGIGIGLAPSSRTFEQGLERIRLSLEPGATLVLYTDGVIEAARPDEAGHERSIQFDERRFLAALERVRTRTAAAICQAVEEEVERFYAGHPRVDDYTVMVLRRPPAADPPETEPAD